jgi:mitochondrial fission protein ELM1
LTRILIVSDGKSGHLNQSLGLAQALRARRPEVTLGQTSPLTPRQAWLSLMTGRVPMGLDRPALLVGAGHATHLTLLALKRCWGVPAVVLMKPSLPLRLFDLCLIPEHDAPPSRANVMATRGALNRMQPAAKVPGSGMILIGGPSRNSGWQETRLLEQLRALVRRDPRPWRLTTSRRTPASTLAQLARLQGVELFPVDSTGPGWLPDQLATTEQCWVTEDSVSMIYEALTAGCAVGALEVPWQRKGRLYRGLQQLKQRGLLTAYAQWSGAPLQAPAEGFNESARCAEAILERGWL